MRKTTNGFTLNLSKRNLGGFTIIELLIVITVIGILAAIGVVSFSSTQAKSRDSQRSSKTTIITDALEKYYNENGEYPTCAAISQNSNTVATTILKGIDPNALTAPTASSGTNSISCSSIPSSSNDVFAYMANNGQRMIEYYSGVTNQPILIATIHKCPSGFIIVPGSTTYGTSDFCVMKYEAKRVGVTNVPISTAASTPWVSIAQTNGTHTDATTYSQNVADCTGCHLITEAEWMTIVQNVLSVSSNWSSGIVGTDYIYSGHNDNAPANALAADTNDSNGYYGETNIGGNQRRTLTLTNGEVIWDMAGNVHEWTSGTTTGGQPGVAYNGYGSWIQWPNVTIQGTLSPNPFPAGTNINGAGAWTSTNGIGQLLSNPTETSARAFLRGGAWKTGIKAGVLNLNFGPGPPSITRTGIGFRVSR